MGDKRKHISSHNLNNFNLGKKKNDQPENNAIHSQFGDIVEEKMPDPPKFKKNLTMQKVKQPKMRQNSTDKVNS